MKPKCFLFLVLLGFGRLGLTVSSFDESNVKSYHVERLDFHPDLFVVKMKRGVRCFGCGSFRAFYQPIPCGCTCPVDYSTFLPSLRNCTNQLQLPANFTGDVKDVNTWTHLIFLFLDTSFGLTLHVHTRFFVKGEGGGGWRGVLGRKDLWFWHASVKKHPKTGCTFHPDPISFMINRNFPSQSWWYFEELHHFCDDHSHLHLLIHS